MATLALKPVFPVRPGSSHPKRNHRHADETMHSAPWRTASVTLGAIALAFFCVLAPLIGNPAGRLFALDATPTLPAHDLTARDAWRVLAFEFTPITVGPAIAAEVLTLLEQSTTDEASGVVTMPELEVSALEVSATE